MKNSTWYRTHLLFLARTSRDEAQRHKPSTTRSVLIINANKLSKIASKAFEIEPAQLDAYIQAALDSLTTVMAERGFKQEVIA